MRDKLKVIDILDKINYNNLQVLAERLTMKNKIVKELMNMRVAFLEGAIKKESFSYPVLGDFKQKLKKLKRLKRKKRHREKT